MAVKSSLDQLLVQVRSCRVCEGSLDAGPRPIVQVGGRARMVIIGQAPGRRVHESGIPWDDPSGDTLRGWLHLDREQFYDPDLVAIIPMGFCYPGSATSGDKPPRPECAPLWHTQLLGHLPQDRLEVIIGSYAQKRYVPELQGNVTETVARWHELLPGRIVLPHPSPRNRHWLTKNPWFETEALPAIARRVAEVIDGR